MSANRGFWSHIRNMAPARVVAKRLGYASAGIDPITGKEVDYKMMIA
jgi:hypothetical protein